MPKHKVGKSNARAGGIAKTRIDKVGPSGVYPLSGPPAPADAEMIWPGSWGQGKRGAAGYEDHGESELTVSRVTPEKCRDIMTKDPVFCQASDTASIAAKLMKKHNIGALPVTGTLRENKLIGIVTDRDLAIKVVAAGLDPNAITVHEIMTSPVVTCSPDDDYHKAIELMERYRIKRVPAVDAAGRVVGIISEADIALRVPDELTTTEVVRSIVQPN